MSRPPKPPLTQEEAALAIAVLTSGKPKGSGMRTAALAVSNARGAHLAATNAAARARNVRRDWLENQLNRMGVWPPKWPKTPSGGKPEALQGNAPLADFVQFVVDTEDRLSSAATPGQNAGVTEQVDSQPSGKVEETKGATA